MTTRPTVGVVMGGWSSEREVSLATGKAIADALASLGYPTVSFDLTPRNVPELSTPPFEVAFLALHGKYGEDGSIQGLFELVGIPYTGSGIMASALAMDKPTAKALFQNGGLPTPPFIVVSGEVPTGLQSATSWVDKQARPVVVKPAAEGSTVGLTVVSNPENLAAALKGAWEFGETALIEVFIEGRELTVGILGNESLPVIEIKPRGGLYSYQAKYTPNMTEYVVPAPISQDISETLSRLAKGAHQALGCRDYSRVDFRLDHDGQPFILEVNTIPGMTPTSLLPKAARAAGISFEELVERILMGAIRRRSRRDQ